MYRKGVTARVYFPMIDTADNVSFLSGVAGTMVVEVSKDGAALAVATNASTELVTATGIYVLVLTAAEMNADQLIVRATVANALDQMIPLITETDLAIYNGAIHIDTLNGAAGAVVGVNGTPDNPVSTLADLITLRTSTGFRHFFWRGSFTFAEAHTDETWEHLADYDSGNSFLGFGGFDLGGSVFIGGSVGGAWVDGSGDGLELRGCKFFTLTPPTGAFAILRLVECENAGVSALVLNTTSLVMQRCRTDINLTISQGTGGTAIIEDHFGSVALGSWTTGNGVEFSSSTGARVDVSVGFARTLVARGLIEITNLSSTATLVMEGAVTRRLIVSTEGAVVAGGSTTEIRTGQTEADDFWNDMVLVVQDGFGNEVARNIDDYAQVNGAFTVAALPFTPGTGDRYYVLARTGSVPVAEIADGIWDELAADHVGVGTMGLLQNNVDVVVSTRASQTSLDSLDEAIIGADLTAAAGSTTTEIRTGAAQADDFYNGMTLVVVNSAGVVAREIQDYALINGAFTVTPPLPFTPTTGDRVVILNIDGTPGSTVEGGPFSPGEC